MDGSLGRGWLAAAAVAVSGSVAAQALPSVTSEARVSSACKSASAPGPKPSGARPAAVPVPAQVTVNCPVVQDTAVRLVPAPAPAPSAALTPAAGPKASSSAASASLREPRLSEEFAMVAAALLALTMAILGLVALQRALFPAANFLGRPNPALSTERPPPEGDFSFRRHWGSLGGESSGWTLTPRLVRLLGGAVLVLAGAALLSQLLPPREGIAGAAPPAASAPASAAAAASEAG